MRDSLTPEQIASQQIASYREQGFLVVEGFLDAQELQHWRDITDAAVAERVAAKAGKFDSYHSPGSYYAQVFTQCLRLADTHAGMRDLMLDPRLGRMAATLAGVAAIRIWHDQALYKPPFGNATGWHLDNPFWSTDAREVISLWVALDDATLGNGCMWYIPGTHKTTIFEMVEVGPNMGDLVRLYPQWRQIEPVA